MLSFIVNPSNDQIRNLPFTEKELQHKSRHRLGYHVYVSYLFYAFHKATSEEKKQLLLKFKVWSEREEQVDENESTSSSDSSDASRVPSCHDVSRVAGLVWRSYSKEQKEEWGNRATVLNSRPRNDGRFIDVPMEVTARSIEDCVKESLTQEWLNFVHLVRNAVVLKRNTVADANRVVTMGMERIELGIQVFRKFILSPLLRTTIFGSPLFSKLQSHELVYQSKKVAAVHIHSHQRLNDLLMFGGIRASVHFNKGSRIRVVPKVSLMDSMGRSAIGYVLQENATHLGVRVEGNVAGELAWVPRVPFDSVSSQYMYRDEHSPSGQKSEVFHISYFWPTRLTLNLTTGYSYLITSQYTCNNLNE